MTIERVLNRLLNNYWLAVRHYIYDGMINGTDSDWICAYYNSGIALYENLLVKE